MNRWVLCVFLLAFFGRCLIAQEAPPGYGAAAQYRLGVGARALGLAWTGTALSQGHDAVYWNPAALPVSANTAGATQVFPFGGPDSLLGIEIQYLGLAIPLDQVGFGAGWFNSIVRDIPYTDESGIIGYFNYQSSLLLLGFGFRRQLGEGLALALGTTAKVYFEQMLAGSALGLGWDLGFTLDFKRFRLAYVSQDFLGTRYSWRGTVQQPEVEVPWVHRLGISAEWLEGTLLTSIEAVFELPSFLSLRGGLEWIFGKILALRAGLRVDRQADQWWPIFTAGLGVKQSWFSLDAGLALRALPAVGELSTTSVYGLSLELKL